MEALRIIILFANDGYNGIVVPDMKLSPNVGSDRSWVWNAAADVSEGEPEAQTLAIRFANSDSKLFYFHFFNLHYLH